MSGRPSPIDTPYAITLVVVKATDGDEWDAMVKTTVPTLEWLQATVGGHIESFSTGTWTGYCNEDGKNLGLTPNPTATALASTLGWAGRGHDVLVGDCVFCGPPDPDGWDTDVPVRVLEAMAFLYQMMSPAVAS